jgi:hypothetical protein
MFLLIVPTRGPTFKKENMHFFRICLKILLKNFVAQLTDTPRKFVFSPDTISQIPMSAIEE